MSQGLEVDVESKMGMQSEREGKQEDLTRDEIPKGLFLDKSACYICLHTALCCGVDSRLGRLKP